MTDRTNAPYDPEAAETSQEWAARVGQEHDTWHKPDDGGSPPTIPSRPTVASITPNAAEGPITVVATIIGTNFLASSTAQIGVIEAVVTFVSATELSVSFANPASGTNRVTVTNGVVDSAEAVWFYS
jgi:hypothetical protein